MSQGTRVAIDDQIDIFAIGKRYRRLILVNVTVAVTVFVALAYILPPKFKSIGTLTIYSKYFQNPLVKDFIPELSDGIELRAQRENLIRQSFSDEYLEELGKKYHLLKYGPNTPEHLTEMEELRKDIEIFPVQATTFNVGFTNRDRVVTYNVAKDAIKRVVDTLLNERRQTIVKARDSIQRRVEGISLSAPGRADPMAAARPDVLRKEYLQLQEQVAALENQYTPQHPKVMKLRERMNLLQSWMRKSAPSRENFSDKPLLIDGEQKTVTKEVYDDLLKKLNYLNVLLDMDQDITSEYVSILTPPNRPISAVWPNKPMFLFWGLLTGLLASAIVILATEYYERTAPTARDFANELSLPYFGNLPRVPWADIKQTAKPGGRAKKPRPRFEEWN